MYLYDSVAKFALHRSETVSFRKSTLRNVVHNIQISKSPFHVQVFHINIAKYYNAIPHSGFGASITISVKVIFVMSQRFFKFLMYKTKYV